MRYDKSLKDSVASRDTFTSSYILTTFSDGHSIKIIRHAPLPTICIDANNM